MSVAFDFNASLNDFALVLPILLPVDDRQREFVKPLCFFNREQRYVTLSDFSN